MKEYRISARLPEDLKKRLEAVERKLGIDQALIARKCIEALVDYVEQNGEITFPLEISPKRKRAPIYQRRDEGEAILIEENRRRDTTPKRSKP